MTAAVRHARTHAARGDKYTGLDRFGRIVDQRWINSGGTAIDRYQYTYDADSNVLTKTNVVAWHSPQVHSDFDESYTYDGLNRLTQVTNYNSTSNSNNQTFALDALGNMGSVTTAGVLQTRTTNSLNQLTVIGGATMSYDAAGNLLVDNQGRTLIWDAWNHLVGVKDASGNLVKAYTYDGLGRKVTDRAGNTGGSGSVVIDDYLSSSWQLLDEVWAGVTQANYLWAPTYIDALVYRNSTAYGQAWGSAYALVDANYNVTALESSGVQERFSYNAYGTRTELNSSWAASADTKNINVGFQGLFHDSATGLWYDRNRWYSDKYQRAISADPAGYPDGASRYWMYAGNPINYLDPEGLQAMAASQPSFPIDISYPVEPHMTNGWGPDFQVKYSGDLIAHSTWIQHNVLTVEITNNGGKTSVYRSSLVVREASANIPLTDINTFGMGPLNDYQTVKAEAGAACHMTIKGRSSTMFVSAADVKLIKNDGSFTWVPYDQDKHSGPEQAKVMVARIVTGAPVPVGGGMHPLDDPAREMDDFRVSATGKIIIQFSHVFTADFDIQNGKPINFIGEVAWNTGNPAWDAFLHRDLKLTD